MGLLDCGRLHSTVGLTGVLCVAVHLYGACMELSCYGEAALFDGEAAVVLQL